MRPFTMFTIGTMARVISVIATHYGDWLLNKIMENREKFDFWTDFKRFCHWLLTLLAEQFSGRRMQRWPGYEEEEYEPELFGAR